MIARQLRFQKEMGFRHSELHGPHHWTGLPFVGLGV